MLAVRAPGRGRGAGRSRNVWQLLAEVAPELGEWAAFFASCSDTRAAAEAGIARLVGRRDADDLLRQAEQFVGWSGARAAALTGPPTGRPRHAPTPVFEDMFESWQHPLRMSPRTAADRTTDDWTTVRPSR